MPRGGNNDPLEGWGNSNLAAPKRQGQAYSIQATQYDDDPRQSPYSDSDTSPPRGRRMSRNSPSRSLNRPLRSPPSPSRSPIRPGRNPSQSLSRPGRIPSRSPSRPGRSRSRRPSPSRPGRSLNRTPRSTSRNYSLSPPSSRAYTSRSHSRGRRRTRTPPPRSNKVKLTAEEKAACPKGDTRWPPRGEWDEPLQLLYTEDGVKKHILYNLLYENEALEASSWRKKLGEKAHAAAMNLDGGKSPETVITEAMNDKKLVPISKGSRGKIWCLDRKHLGVWAKIQSEQEEVGNVTVAERWEKFEAFRVAVKAWKEDALLISWDFDELDD